MNNENNPTNPSELDQQEILSIVEKLKERYQLEEGDSLYQLAITLYKNGIRHNMFSKENFQEKIFLDEIVKYLVETKPPKDIKPYEIKRHLTSTTISEPNINPHESPNIIDIIDYQEKQRYKKKK